MVGKRSRADASLHGEYEAAVGAVAAAVAYQAVGHDDMLHRDLEGVGLRTALCLCAKYIGASLRHRGVGYVGRLDVAAEPCVCGPRLRRDAYGHRGAVAGYDHGVREPLRRLDDEELAALHVGIAASAGHVGRQGDGVGAGSGVCVGGVGVGGCGAVAEVPQERRAAPCVAQADGVGGAAGLRRQKLGHRKVVPYVEAEYGVVAVGGAVGVAPGTGGGGEVLRAAA